MILVNVGAWLLWFREVCVVVGVVVVMSGRVSSVRWSRKCGIGEFCRCG